MLRKTLLFLSTQRNIRHFVETSTFTQRVTSRFVAGTNLNDCLRACLQLNESGIAVTLDYLGESISDLNEAQESKSHYLAALAEIEKLQLKSTVSLKPTQFGLGLSMPACRANIRTLVEVASRIGSRVEVDMEDSKTTDQTLELVRDFHAEFGCVRAVIQAYLFRSEADIRDLNSRGIPVRLCKGAYQESDNLAFADKADVDANYRKLTELLLTQGNFPAIATHDPNMISHACKISKKHGIPSNKFEFQMLYGIKRDLQTQLVGQGFEVRSYVPYGDAWYPYFMRRLAERPANLWFVAKNLFA
jgi:proline dehydrogenase